MENALVKINLINQQTVGWKVRLVESGPVHVSATGIKRGTKASDLFYKDPPSFIDFDIHQLGEYDPDPSIGHEDISLLCEIITADPHSFYWNKNVDQEKVMYSLVYLESIVPEIREKKTVILFKEEHLRPDCKDKSLRLLEELCSHPENEVRRQYWEDVPDSTYDRKR